MGRARSPIPRSRLPLHRRALADRGALRSWLLVVAGALLVFGGVARAVQRASAAEAAWGHLEAVLVATASVDAGRSLHGHVRVERWPAGLIPHHALTRLPPGARAAGPLDRGVPLTVRSVQRSASGPDAGSGTGVVAVPVGEAALPLRRGDRVDVWATTDPALAGGELGTARVARRAVVERVGADSVAVAVDDADVDDVVEALATAIVTLVVVR